MILVSQWQTPAAALWLPKE